MAGEKTTKVVLDLDNREFVSKMKESLGLVGELGKTDSLKELASQFQTIGAIAGVVGAAVLAVKASIDLVEEAEHIKQVNQAFETLATNAGLAADVIKDDLVKAAHGLADDTDIINAANKAIVSMGANAAKLPEIMDLARKSTNLFGGDLVQNFEAMNQALAAGNVRMLRQFGIIVDVDKAHKEYAKTLGVGVEFLTETAKRQAVMNAALEQGKEKFKNVDESTTATTQNIKKLSVSFEELKETAILAWDKVAGPTVRKATSDAAEIMHTWAVKFKDMFGQGKDQQEAHIENLKIQIAYYEKMIGSMSEVDKRLNAGGYAQATKMLEGYKKQLAEVQKKEEEADERAMHRASMEHQTGGGEKPAVEAAPQVDYEKLKEARLKFEKELAQIKMQRSQADLETAQTEEQATIAYNERVVALSLEMESKRAQIKKDFYDKGVITEQQYQDAIDQINRTQDDKLKNYDLELQDARIKALENYKNHATGVAQGVGAAFAAEGAKAHKDLQNWGNFGTTVFGSFKKNAVNAFKAIGDGSQNAGEAMKGFMFNSIADIAEAHGEVMLAEGIGTMNPVEVAEGGALIALSSAIRSQAGGKGGGGGGISGGGGGGGSADGGIPGGDQAAQANKPEVTTQPKKTVTLNIHGSYFDTDQSRTRIMEMIRESGDFTDFNISKIGPG